MPASEADAKKGLGPFDTAYGRLRLIRRDGELVWQLECPVCEEWGDLDEDQLNGRVSAECDRPRCGYHETHDFAGAIREGRKAPDCPYCGEQVETYEVEGAVFLGEHPCEGAGVAVEFAKVEVVARLGEWEAIPTDRLAEVVRVRLEDGEVAELAESVVANVPGIERDFRVARDALEELVRRAGA